MADGTPHNNVANLLDCVAQCAAAGGGTVLLPAGTIVTSEASLGPVTADSGRTYTNNGGIPLPVNCPITFQGQGVGVTTLRLSSGFTRGFDFWYLADGQSYKNITIRGITFDRGSMNAATIAPLTTYSGTTLTLPSGTPTVVPGLSASAFKNCIQVGLPATNVGTAKNM